MKQRTALVTGAPGQDGSYLVEMLLEKGYSVVGAAVEAEGQVAGLMEGWRRRVADGRTLTYRSIDLTDAEALTALVLEARPDEIYNLAAQSHVPTSFAKPQLTLQVNGAAVVTLLEAIRTHVPEARLFSAASAEIFGNKSGAVDESTPLEPVSPYGASKAYAMSMVRVYRRAYGTYACSGIFFNHESERRPESFVTRKITSSLARIKLGRQDVLHLGNLDAQRDWGYAPDYVEAAWRTLQADAPDDYVIATGVPHSVRDFVNAAAKAIDFDLEWRGEGLDAHAVDRASGRTLVAVDPQFYRPIDIDALYGNAAKAEAKLGWTPTVPFEDLVARLVADDIARESAAG